MAKAPELYESQGLLFYTGRVVSNSNGFTKLEEDSFLLKLSKYRRSASLIKSDRVLCSHLAMKSTCSSMAGGKAMSTFFGMGYKLLCYIQYISSVADIGILR